MGRCKAGFLVVLMSLPLMARAEWQAAASARYSLLWKPITFTQLWVDSRQAAPQDILDPRYAKRIVIEYALGVSAHRFRDMVRQALGEAYTRAELAPHWPEIERFCSWLTAVEKGDLYSLVWQPQRGLELRLNQRLLGRIEAPESASMILSVWLGRAAISAAQRDELLAQWRRYLERERADK